MISDHDKQRILQGAEQFYEILQDPIKRDDVIEDVTLDQFLIIGIVSAQMEGGGEFEVPVLWGSTRRIFVQRGILETMLDRMKAGGIEGDDDEENGDEEEVGEDEQ